MAWPRLFYVAAQLRSTRARVRSLSASVLWTNHGILDPRCLGFSSRFAFGFRLQDRGRLTTAKP